MQSIGRKKRRVQGTPTTCPSVSQQIVPLSSEINQASIPLAPNDVKKKAILIQKKCLLKWPGITFQRNSKYEIQGSFYCLEGRVHTTPNR